MSEPLESAKMIARSLSDDAYLLLPGDGRRHFVGEAVLIGIGGALLTGFIAGVTATLKDRALEWGKQASTWLLGKIEGVLNADDAAAEGVAELDAEVSEAAQAAAGNEKAPDITLVTQIVLVILTDNGMTEAAAARVANDVRAQATLLLSEAGVSGV
jgi:hypothetical protein